MSTGVKINHAIVSPDWHTWRSQGLGASDAASACKASRYKSAYRLWLEKTGQAQREPENEAMRWGHRMEPIILDAYRERTGLTTGNEQACLEHPDLPWMRCTLDAMAGEDCCLDRLVEIKTVGMHAARTLGEDGDSDSLPTNWLLQVQHQLAVSHCVWADVAVFHPSLQLRIYPIRRNDELIEALIQSESEFWGCVQDNRPPAPETLEDYLDWTKRTQAKGSRIAIANDEALHDADLYLEACEQAKESDQRKSELRYALIRHLAGSEYGDLADGRIIRAQTVEIAERTQTVKAHSQVRISIKGEKNEYRAPTA